MSDVSLIVNSSIDHLPAFSVNPPGVLVLRRHTDRDRNEWWQIRKADSQVEFSNPLLESLATGENPNGGVEYPCMRLDMPVDRYDTCGRGAHPGLCFLDALLHIEGRHRDDLTRDHHVVYRIIGYNPRIESWIARWPD